MWWSKKKRDCTGQSATTLEDRVRALGFSREITELRSAFFSVRDLAENTRQRGEGALCMIEQLQKRIRNVQKTLAKRKAKK